MALPKVHLWSGMPPVVLCRAVQELHRSLTPLVEQHNLVRLQMLDMAKKDSAAPPVPTEGASSSEPRAEEPIDLLAPEKPPALEPKEAAHSEELALEQEEKTTCSPWVTLSWVDKSDPSPLRMEPHQPVYPWGPGWTWVLWRPYRWQLLITPWWGKYSISTSLWKLLGYPCSWIFPNPWTTPQLSPTTWGTMSITCSYLPMIK